MVRLRAIGDGAGCDLPGQSADRRLSAFSLRRARSAELGKVLLASLSTLDPRPSRLVLAPRGLGLLVGLEVCLQDGAPATEAALRLVKSMLQRGFILLPEGEHSNVIGFTPPLTISPNQIKATVNAMQELLAL